MRALYAVLEARRLAFVPESVTDVYCSRHSATLFSVVALTPSFPMVVKLGSRAVKPFRGLIFLSSLINGFVSIPVLVLGFYLRFTPDPQMAVFGMSRVHSVGITLIIIGVAVLGTALVGGISAVKGDKRLEFAYFFFLLFLTLALFGIGGYSYYYRSALTQSTADVMDSKIIADYGFDHELTNIIDQLQVDRHCCGGSSYRVYELSQWASGKSEITAKNGQVPDSCCARGNSGELVNATACYTTTELTEVPDLVYTRGCFTLMEETVEGIVFVFSVCMLSFAVWLLIMTLLAGYVWRTLPRMVLL
nr:unnamed protein product [Spirometra erinaceieuropaei]